MLLLDGIYACFKRFHMVLGLTNVKKIPAHAGPLLGLGIAATFRVGYYEDL